jgi:UDP-N-acetylglucosamine--N-acetylmuramyl-(pentapeptide) pyrophosphoryl-undecaprenol N-acetylglucosamine transferase
MKILLAGGGTAGHIEPALAVARQWRARHPEDEIFFIGTARGLEVTLVPAAGFALHLIPKVAIARKISLSLLAVPFQLLSSIAATRKLLKGVDLAVGFGGYVSAPLYIAAALARTPFMIHEQNAHPGWANRLGARFTPHLAMSYPIHGGALSKAELTGLPLRSDVISAIAEAAPDWQRARIGAKDALAKRYGVPADKPLIFIFGGSQGSQAINAVIESSRAALTGAGISILHGIGKNNPLPESSDLYKPLHYIDEMAECYLGADLLIARSGAVTCAEADALARYSLFIPLPIGNGEQALNADTLIAQGRAELLAQQSFTPQWLIANIDALLAKSGEAPLRGNDAGISAVDKILAIMERAAGAR